MTTIKVGVREFRERIASFLIWNDLSTTNSVLSFFFILSFSPRKQRGSRSRSYNDD